MSHWMRGGLGLILLLVAATNLPAALADETNLTVSGKIPGGELSLTRDQLRALPQHELTEQPTNFPAAAKFSGPLLADVLKLAGAAAGDAMLVALDEYKVTITADEMARYGPIFALELDGVTLEGSDFGPYFVMWPFKEKPEIDTDSFQSRAIWQVIKIDVQ